jgi:F-type H+-transporting ATPase subunit alpha
MPVAEQVVSIYAGTNGYLDDVPVADVGRFEAELIEDVRSRNASMLDALAKGGGLPEDELRDAVQSFKDRFVATASAAE